MELENFVPHMVNWAGHYVQFVMPLAAFVDIFYFALLKGRNSHLAEMDVCLHTLYF